MTELKAILAKWFLVLGRGLHADNDGSDYACLTLEQTAEYDRDLARAFELADQLGVDVHEVRLEVTADA